MGWRDDLRRNGPALTRAVLLCIFQMATIIFIFEALGCALRSIGDSGSLWRWLAEGSLGLASVLALQLWSSWKDVTAGKVIVIAIVIGRLAAFLALAALVPLVIEGVWALYSLGRGWSVAWRSVPVKWEFLVALTILLGLRSWASLHLASFLRARNALTWTHLANWTKAQKVSSWGLSIVLAFVYAIDFLQEFVLRCDDPYIWWISKQICAFDKKVMAFRFLSQYYEAHDILTIVLLGLLLSVVAIVLNNVWIPPTFQIPPSSSLADSLREWHHGIAARDLYNTISYHLSREAEKPGNDYDWSPAQRNILRLEAALDGGDDAQAALVAGETIDLFPPQNTQFLDRMTRLLFNVLFPTKRWALVGILAVSEILIAFPVSVRILLIFFRKLEEAPPWM